MRTIAESKKVIRDFDDSLDAHCFEAVRFKHDENGRVYQERYGIILTVSKRFFIEYPQPYGSKGISTVAAWNAGAEWAEKWLKEKCDG